jgi:hypothetical protein
MKNFLYAYVRNISEKAITYPPKNAPKGLPIPPTIAAAKIGSMLLK